MKASEKTLRELADKIADSASTNYGDTFGATDISDKCHYLKVKFLDYAEANEDFNALSKSEKDRVRFFYNLSYVL